MFKLQRTIHTQSAIYISDTHVTLKQSQGHQTQNDSVDLKEYYNHEKFKKSCCKDVWVKANVKFVSKQGNMSIISLKHDNTCT